LDAVWNAHFPGKIPDDLTPADPLDGDSFELEGHELVAVEVGHTDTDATSVLHVPAIGLVVAGDAAYNGIHQYIAEADEPGRRDWIEALGHVEALKPEAVVAGHKQADRADDPAIIEETRQYIRDFDRLLGSADGPEDLYEQMLALYPDRVNP